MQRGWWRGGFSALLLFATSLLISRGSVADTIGSPEFDLYWTHNNLLRSRFAASANWSDGAAEFTNAALEYDLDISLWSYFRRYVFKDPNAEKSKRISFRAGYMYIPNLTSGVKTSNENRWLTDVTFRQPIGNAWLITDRNRGELRYLNSEQTWRYRNRLRAERNFSYKGFRATPYFNAEAFYDGKAVRWNELDETLGSEFPWYYKTILEFYVTWQFRESAADNQIFGVTLQKHL